MIQFCPPTFEKRYSSRKKKCLAVQGHFSFRMHGPLSFLKHWISYLYELHVFTFGDACGSLWQTCVKAKLLDLHFANHLLRNSFRWAWLLSAEKEYMFFLGSPERVSFPLTLRNPNKVRT